MRGLILTGLMLPSIAGAASFYLDQRTFGDSAAIPAAVLTEGWDVPRSAGTLSQAFNWSEAGFRQGRWSMGLLYRHDAIVRYDEQTLALMQHAKRRDPLEPGQEYNLDFRVDRLEAVGLRLARRFSPAPRWTVGVGASLLQATYLTRGHLKGRATAVGEKDYDFHFDVDYHYSQDYLFNRQVTAPEGWGYSFDLNLRWQPRPGVDLRLRAVDVLSRINWPLAPHTQASGDSTVKQYDDQGYVEFVPIMSGRETTEALSYRLPPRGTFTAEFGEGRRRLLAQWFATPDRLYPRLGFRLQRSAGEVGLLYTLTTGTLSARYATRHWHVGIGLDALSPRRLHNAYLLAGFSLPVS